MISMFPTQILLFSIFLDFWKINFCTILNNTNYCVVLSQKNSKTKNNNDVIYSRISFIKYPNEKFISQESIPEELIYCAYNPKNTIELILCGVGYLRLWNIKAKKIKERDDALEDALDVINNKRIKDATDKLLEVLKVRKITHDVTSARGVDFLNRLRKLYDKWIELVLIKYTFKMGYFSS